MSNKKVDIKHEKYVIKANTLNNKLTEVKLNIEEEEEVLTSPCRL
ncbi:hypothetical protein [Alkalicella caledoniensis]|nr:hypothetical protein [Alkalicella caledoniensis]